MKINHKFSEQQLLEIDDCRKKAAKISMYIETLSWLFDAGSNEEAELLKFSHMAAEIEIFCEEQLPF